MTALVGWWLVPFAITVAAFVRHFWSFRHDDIGADPIIAMAWLLAFVEAMVVSLAAWLVWALAVIIRGVV